MRILSVDDSSIVRKIIRSAAEILACEVEEAENGPAALRTLEEFGEPIDLILLDWNMPGMSGLELLRLLKSSPRYQEIPVMMVTSESEKSSIIEAIQAGAAHYLVKPFTIEELTKRVLECLGEEVCL